MRGQGFWGEKFLCGRIFVGVGVFVVSFLQIWLSSVKLLNTTFYAKSLLKID